MKQVILLCSLFVTQMTLEPSFAIPAGNYSQSCHNIQEQTATFLTASTLTASCQTKNGQSVPAKLSNYTSCKKGTINNDNGKLVCERQFLPGRRGIQ